MNQQQALNAIAANRQLGGGFNTQLALAALVLLDKYNMVQFDADDLPGTLARIVNAAAAAQSNIVVPVTSKVSFTTAQIAALTGASGDLPALTLPAKAVVLSTTVKHSAALAAVDLSAATARLISAQNNYGTAFDVFQAPGAEVFDFYGTAKSEKMGGTSLINLHLVLTDSTLDLITAGAIDAWITWFVRP